MHEHSPGSVGPGGSCMLMLTGQGQVRGDDGA